MKSPPKKNRKTYKGPNRRPLQKHQKSISYSPGRKGRRSHAFPKWITIAGVVVLLALIISSIGYLRKRNMQDDANPQNLAVASTTVVTKIAPTQASSSSVTPTMAEDSQSSSEESTSAPAESNEIPTPDIEALRALMVQLVNQEREKEGLTAVKADEVAQKAGQNHAEEMAEFGYLSHWDIDGFGPDYRYVRADGTNYVQENVASYAHRFDTGTPFPIQDWNSIIEQVHTNLMNSAGHRANILNPDHTHLGVGIAYNPANGEMRIAQEFVNRYSNTKKLALLARPGDRLTLRGTLLSGASDPIAILSYESIPEPMTLSQLNETGSFHSPAEKIKDLKISTSGKKFVVEILLDRDMKPGLYHVFIFANTQTSKHTPIIDRIIEVR